MKLKLPTNSRDVPAGWIIWRLSLLAFAVVFFVVSLVTMVRAGVLGWALDAGNDVWRAVREWLLPW